MRHEHGIKWDGIDYCLAGILWVIGLTFVGLAVLGVYAASLQGIIL